MNSSCASQDHIEVTKASLEGHQDDLAEVTKDIDALIAQLEDHALELDAGAADANQVLPAPVLEFLSSEMGREFGESLRLKACERLEQSTRSFDSMRERLTLLEAELDDRNRVFAFVEALISRLRLRAPA